MVCAQLEQAREVNDNAAGMRPSGFALAVLKQNTIGWVSVMIRVLKGFVGE